jgi:hypothetical protein
VNDPRSLGARRDQSARRGSSLWLNVRECLLLADFVEKVLGAVGSIFLRAAGAFYVVRHGGPHQPEQNLSATFFFA